MYMARSLVAPLSGSTFVEGTYIARDSDIILYIFILLGVGFLFMAPLMFQR